VREPGRFREGDVFVPVRLFMKVTCRGPSLPSDLEVLGFVPVGVRTLGYHPGLVL